MLQIGWERLGFHHATNFCTSGGQSAHVFGVECIQARINAVGQAIKRQKLAKRVGGGGKTSGHAHARGQLRDHFAEAGVFTANHFDIGHSQLFKRDDQQIGMV